MVNAEAAYMLLDRIRSRRGFSIGFPVIAFLLALWVRFVFDEDLPPGFPFLTFFPAVILSSVLGGTVAGIACGLLSFFAAWCWFIPPVGTFYLDGKVALALAFFAVVAGVDILIIHFMHAAMGALAREKENSSRLAAEQSRLAEQQKQLFQELQHRVSNNFQIVSSLLGIQERKLHDVPEAAGALKEARARLDLMSRVHRRLYLSSTDGVVLEEYMRQLIDEILAAGSGTGVHAEVEADPLNLSVDQLTNLSLIVLEALMNAMKYGLPHAGTGRVRLLIRRIDDASAYAEFSDDGPGYPSDFNPAESRQLGFKLMRGFAGSLRGTLSFANTPGATVRVEFPLACD